MEDPDDSYAENNKHWHVNKGIPLAFILTMAIFTLGQTGTVAWYFSRQDGRIEVLEKAQALMTPQTERLARVEEKLESVKSGISDIKATLTAQEASRRSNR